MTAPEGTYLEIGNINVGWKAEFDPSWIIFGNRRIIGLAHYEAEHLRGALDLMRRTLNKYPVGPRGVPQVPARADQRGIRPAGQGSRHPRCDRPELSGSGGTETMASERDAAELRMDSTSLYREETFTDRRMGMIRVLTPVTKDGLADASRRVVYLGEAQLLTQMGALPLTFEIEAGSLGEATEKFAAGAKVAVERAVKELQEMRREAASPIIIPDRVPRLPDRGQAQRSKSVRVPHAGDAGVDGVHVMVDRRHGERRREARSVPASAGRPTGDSPAGWVHSASQACSPSSRFERSRPSAAPAERLC